MNQLFKITLLDINTSTWERIFKGWGEDIVGFFKTIASSFVIPVAIAVLIVLIAIQIARLVKMNNDMHGDEMGRKVGALVITIVVTILLGTFSAWGYNLF